MKTISSDPQKLSFVVFLCVLFLALSAGFATAQRISYEALKIQERIPTAYFDYNIIPPSSPGEDPQLVVGFKLGYDFLNFRRDSGNDDDRRFYSDVEIGVEIFGVEDQELSSQEREELYTDRIQETQSARRAERRRSRRSDEERESVGREFWNGTAYAATYEQTQSSNQHLEGYIVKSLPPGSYEINSRFSSDQRTRNTLPKRITIPDFDENGDTQIYFLDEDESIDLPVTSPLINMGRNVFFGKDFNALILVPDYDEQAEYRLQLKKIGPDRDDTSSVTVYDEALSDSDIYKGVDVHLTGSNDEAVKLSLSQDEETPYTFASIKVPNSRFENAHYRMEIWQNGSNGENERLGNRTFLNRWVDIPTSLLNLDVAINMMQFILDDEALSRMEEGNQRQREEKFREFWNERNPTPETEYNELMVEYFRRIDYAFENYTSPREAGYESDMGRIYIQNGEPDNVTRRFPSNEPAVVIWEYGPRIFRFEATSGFGDYELKETR
ncbi:MAG: GWxTD domain-containing protein [Balneolales bacterium]